MNNFDHIANITNNITGAVGITIVNGYLYINDSTTGLIKVPLSDYDNTGKTVITSTHNNCRGLAYYQNSLYVGHDNGTIGIYDLTLRKRGVMDLGGSTIIVNNIIVNRHYLYVACRGGLQGIAKVDLLRRTVVKYDKGYDMYDIAITRNRRQQTIAVATPFEGSSIKLYNGSMQPVAEITSTYACWTLDIDDNDHIHCGCWAGATSYNIEIYDISTCTLIDGTVDIGDETLYNARLLRIIDGDVYFIGKTATSKVIIGSAYNLKRDHTVNSQQGIIGVNRMIIGMGTGIVGATQSTDIQGIYKEPETQYSYGIKRIS